MGVNLVVIPALSQLSLYFDRKRGMAVSISMSACGLGGMIFAPAIDMLFREYGFSGAMLIIGGLNLNSCVAGALIRPVVRAIKASPQTRKQGLEKMAGNKAFITSRLSLAILETPTASMLDLRTITNDTYFHESRGQSRDPVQKIYQSQELSLPPPSFRPSSPNGASHHIDTNMVSQSSPCLAPNSHHKILSLERGLLLSSHKPSTSRVFTEEGLDPNTKTCKLSFSSLRVRKGNFRSWLHGHAANLLCLFGFDMLRRLEISTFCLFCAAYYFAFGVLNTLISGLAKEISLTDSEIAIMISISHGIDIISSLSAGAAFDNNWIRKRKVVFHYAMTLIACLSLIITPIASNLPVMYFFCIMDFSMLNGVYTLSSSMVAGMVDPYRVVSMMGLMRFVMGLGGLTGPVVGGTVYSIQTFYQIFQIL